MNLKSHEPRCPYCGNVMTLVTLSLQYPPDIQQQYQCLRCGSAAPKGTTEENAYHLAEQRSCEGKVKAVDEKELEKLVEKYQKKADKAEETYQKTGMARYHETYWRNQVMADALRMAMSAKDDHDTLREMRLILSNFASRGAAAVSPKRAPDERAELAARLAAEVADYGRRNGLI